MLIIEGPDCVGKTTFANKVTEYANTQLDGHAYYQHMTRPSKHFDFCYDYVDMMSIFGVMDRFHLGAFAYHPVGTMTLSKLSYIEGELLVRGSFIVVMYDSIHEHYKGLLEKDPRKQMFDKDTLMGANHVFRDIALKKYGCKVHLSIDVANGFPNDDIIAVTAEQWMLNVKVILERKIKWS